MFTLVNNKIEESKNMERLRDTLLPKLLSGELSVEAIELAAE
jgi:type I restriction enzyme, S subunit